MKPTRAIIAVFLVASSALAARNNAGVYSLPSGNPVSTGTTITSSWANNTLSDISSELTNSLDRGGRGAMTAAIQLYTGTVSAPAMCFATETSSGIYRAASHDVRLSINGQDQMRWSPIGTDVFHLIQAITPAPQAPSFYPLGNDLELRVQGSADMHLETWSVNVTSATSVTGGAGSQAVTVNTLSVCPSSATASGSCYAPPGTVTSQFCPPSAGCGLLIDEDSANYEFIGSANWTITDGTHISFTPSKSHTTPFIIRQRGVMFEDTRYIVFNQQDVSDRPVTLADKGINTIATVPNDITGGTWPSQGFAFNAFITGSNGANKNLLYRNATTSSSFRVISAANTATLFSFGENSNTASLNMGNATNTSLALQAASDVGRIKGGGTSSGINFYGNVGGAGTSGTFSFRNNGTDEVEAFRVTATGGTSSVQIGATGTALTASYGASYTGQTATCTAGLTTDVGAQTLTGVSAGGVCDASIDTANINGIPTCVVTGANTVHLMFHCSSTGSITPLNYRVRVWQP